MTLAMPKTITQLENELTGRKRIKNAVNRAYGVYSAHVDTDQGSLLSKRGIRFNRGKQIN